MGLEAFRQAAGFGVAAELVPGQMLEERGLCLLKPNMMKNTLIAGKLDAQSIPFFVPE